MFTFSLSSLFQFFLKKMHRQICKDKSPAVEELTWAASGLGREINQNFTTLPQLLLQLHPGSRRRELLDQTDADGCTPLMSAAQNDEIDNMRALIKAGASVNTAATKTNLTALMQAAACGQLSAVNWLLANGAEVNHRDANGLTALDHVRISKGNAACANIGYVCMHSLSLIERLLRE
jgi:ankyrin repeat protein